MKTLILAVLLVMAIGCGVASNEKIIYRDVECEQCVECQACDECESDDCPACESCDCSPKYKCITEDPYDLQDWCDNESIDTPITATPCEYVKTDWGTCVTNAPGVIYVDGEIFCGIAVEVTYCCIWDESRTEVIKLYQHLLFSRSIDGPYHGYLYEQTISTPECNDSVWVFGQ